MRWAEYGLFCAWALGMFSNVHGLIFVRLCMGWSFHGLSWAWVALALTGLVMSWPGHLLDRARAVLIM
jgi:uncharacterized protein YgfB (UPF0149 family)